MYGLVPSYMDTNFIPDRNCSGNLFVVVSSVIVKRSILAVLLVIQVVWFHLPFLRSFHLVSLLFHLY